MKRSRFGPAALAAAVLSVLFLAANYGASQLNIAPRTFAALNSITALAACALAPLAILFGVLGLVRKNDSKPASVLALVLTTLPFLILFVQMLLSLTVVE
jgi:cytochrome bd-type quinol oxidase subunit 2